MTTPVELARRFHELYEQQAPQFGYETRTETRNFDPESPNGKLMVSVCDTIIDEYAIGAKFGGIEQDWL